MSTGKKWLVGLGILLGLIILFALPSLWQAWFPVRTYGAMGPHHAQMMGFDRPWIGMGLWMFAAWLIPPGLLVLIGLGIAALVKYLRTPSPG
jgi:hypothetical protein